MSKMTSTGTILAVSAASPATVDASGFGALSFTTVGEAIDIPEYGPTVQVVESNPLATGVTEKFNGFINYGSLSIGLDLDLEDAGQAILEAGVPVPPAQFTPHSFKITFPDGTIEYFVAGIFSYTRNPSTANSMIGSTALLEINSKIIRVAAPS